MFEFTLVIPKQDNNGGSRALASELRASVEAAFARRFGGFTTTDATGGYLGKSGRVMLDPVWRVSIITDDPDAAHAALRRFAKRIRHDLEQESVLWYGRPLSVCEFVASDAHAAI